MCVYGYIESVKIVSRGYKAQKRLVVWAKTDTDNRPVWIHSVHWNYRDPPFGMQVVDVTKMYYERLVTQNNVKIQIEYIYSEKDDQCYGRNILQRLQPTFQELRAFFEKNRSLF